MPVGLVPETLGIRAYDYNVRLRGVGKVGVAAHVSIPSLSQASSNDSSALACICVLKTKQTRSAQDEGRALEREKKNPHDACASSAGKKNVDSAASVQLLCTVRTYAGVLMSPSLLQKGYSKFALSYQVSPSPDKCLGCEMHRDKIWLFTHSAPADRSGENIDAARYVALSYVGASGMRADTEE